jgi:4-amino-4-deoxychorismate lyase
MSLLFETICVRNGKPERLPLHNARLNASRKELHGCTDAIDLQAVLARETFPPEPLVRCRVVYGRDIVSVESTPYHRREIRTLEIVHAGELTYDHKYVDRTALDRLVAGSVADDVLIIRDGFVTDASFANVVFIGNNGWMTPTTPLLRGTQRGYLLSQGVIRESPVREDDIGRFSYVMLINAMREPDPSRAIPVAAIRRRHDHG